VEGEQPSHNLWIYDLERNTKSQFTLGSSANVEPVWSPDGKEIVFASDRSGHVDLYRKSAAGSESERVLLENAAYKFPLDWSPDGKFLLYSERIKQESPNLWALPMNGQEAPRLLLRSPYYDGNACFSPDGRWIAYNSREQGTGQVFVIPFAGNGTKRLVSPGGGLKPHWRKDGKALIYLDDSGNLMETEVSLGESDVSVANTRMLFRGNMEIPSDQGWPYDVASDGRFLINHRSQENQAEIVVVANWNAKQKD
jgi:Tol biopolymer transport system component